MSHANSWHTVINIKLAEGDDEPRLCVDPDDNISITNNNIGTHQLMTKEKAKAVQGKLARQWPECEYIIYKLIKVNADKL